jgi:hypothetical protein
MFPLKRVIKFSGSNIREFSGYFCPASLCGVVFIPTVRTTCQATSDKNANSLRSLEKYGFYWLKSDYLIINLEYFINTQKVK